MDVSGWQPCLIFVHDMGLNSRAYRTPYIHIMQLKNLASPIHSSKNGYLGRGMHQAKHMLNVSKI